jgi:cytochrome P450
MTNFTHPQDYDPLAREEFDTPHEIFADLRGRCPVAHSEAFGGFWMLTRYADIARVLDDPIEFTTRIRNVVPVPQRQGAGHLSTSTRPSTPPIDVPSTAR